jgi:RNA polymerase sigma-70 factor (ECF subfamily)
MKIEHAAIPAQREPADDVETRALAKAGDRDAFAALAAQHRRTIYGYLRKRCRSHELAEDLTQETYVRALRRVGDFREMGRGFGALLVTIAHNLLADHYKAAYTRLTVAVDPGGGLVLDDVDDCDPADEVAARDAARLLRVAMRDLVRDHRTVIELRFFAGLSVAETAEKMGRNVGATKALQTRAVQALARHQVLRDLQPEAVGA